MATAQNHYRLSWCLNIKSATQIYAATTDLPEAAAVTNLGAFYTKRIVNIDAQLTVALPNLFYGMPQSQAVEFTLDNSDLALSSSYEWRLVPVILYHYNRDTDTKTTDFSGVITRARFAGTRVTLTIGTYNGAVMDELLPAAVIDPAVGSAFEETASAGSPVPVIFGENVPVQPPNITVNSVSDPAGTDFAVGHGALLVSGVFEDADEKIAGLEKLGTFTTAPGTPIYVSTTRFSITGDQTTRYYATQPVRFKTTASAGSWVYSEVSSYDATTSPDQIVIAHALLDAGMSNVELGGDYLVVRGYTSITDGLAPAPSAPGVSITAVRTFGAAEARLLVTASNPSFPTATTHIADVIEAILTNEDWGLSVRTPQAVNAASFAAANVLLNVSPSLIGAVQGALGYDQEQRQARNVLDELLMMRGMRLYQNDSSEWMISVDGLPAAVSKSFQLDTGLLYGIPIKRILDHGKVDAEQATRSVILQWSPLGRASGMQKFTNHAFSRSSTKAVSSVGAVRVFPNQWIRSETIAERVTHYLAEKMQGADERLSFVAGQEARDVTLGESITVTVPSDGITGDWQVYGISKTLAEVTLNCIRANATAYDAPSDVTTTSEPIDAEYRTQSSAGTNLLPNPDFGAPFKSDSLGVYWPHQWYGIAAYGVTHTTNASEAVRALTVGDNYITVTTSADEAPTTSPQKALYGTAEWACPTTIAATDTALLASVYCDQTEGPYFVMAFGHGGSTTTKLLQMTRDATDTTGNGWTRYYARTSTPVGTTKAILHIGFTKANSYSLDGALVEVVGRGVRKPSGWRRHKPQPLTQFRSIEVTFSGGTSATATNLIPGGCKVVGVTSLITTALVFGTATSYTIGTAADPSAWGSALVAVALNSRTSADDFQTTTEASYATATSVFVTGNGTINSGGKMMLTVEYTRAAPASGV